MKSNGPWIFITAVVVALIVSSALIFVSFQNNNLQKSQISSQQEARKQCADKIPDDDNSWVGYSSTGAANYTNYPRFDRCMASKGF
ncbi:hypothetical protein KC874_01590 [Candidatus Saccharibacteria bacterium]|nr:hypothetical protein [Candidatus Saccharibacteria bacterium]